MANRINIDESQIDNTIWRYTNFIKFVDLLETGNLFFANPKKYDDKYEGRHNALGQDDHYDLVDGNLVEAKTPYDTRSDTNSAVIKGFFNHNLTKTLSASGIQCWTMKDNDSNVMWHTYAQLSYAVAVISTPRKLVDSLKLEECHQLTYGRVRYIDYNNEKLPIHSVVYPLFHKRKHFSEEDEFRLCITRKDAGKYIKSENGFSIAVDVNEMIDGVIVSPKSPDWFVSLCKTLCRKRGLDVDISPSELFKPSSNLES